MMDYKAIACLQQVIESQSFEKAGDALGLTQSAVSQKIKKLEVQYGAPLLLREKPLALTALGAKLIAHLMKVQLMEQALLTDETKNATRQKLVIGVNNDSLATWVMSAFSNLLAAEKVQLQVKTADQSQTRHLLQKGEIVAGICDIGTPVVGGDSTFLGFLNYVLVAAPTYIEKHLTTKSTLAELAQLPALVFNENDELWKRYQEDILQVKQNLNHCHWLPSSEGFVTMLLSGTVCAVIPSIQIKRELQQGLLIELLPGKKLSVPLYWHWYNLNSPALEKLTDLIKTEALTALVH
ncbi:ArgP/LysG family DNA-binding transcriptional regulator [Marinomonas agarivorans]|nr:ArgP/LysG family DNA-binding transcriptional regulator [Marinomonas agarivorans]